MDSHKERQGDYVFTAQEAGEHRFCFDNSATSFSDEKMVDFEVMVCVHLLHSDMTWRTLLITNDSLASQVEDETPRASLPQKAGASNEQLSVVEETVLKLSGQISTLTRQQKYFRTRENRNFSTVRSTEKRIFNFSLIEVGVMMGMAGLQVFIVKMFFTGGRKGNTSLTTFLQSSQAVFADQATGYV